jgi:hypothetical protein
VSDFSGKPRTGYPDSNTAIDPAFEAIGGSVAEKVLVAGCLRDLLIGFRKAACFPWIEDLFPDFLLQAKSRGRGKD